MPANNSSWKSRSTSVLAGIALVALIGGGAISCSGGGDDKPSTQTTSAAADGTAVGDATPSDASGIELTDEDSAKGSDSADAKNLPKNAVGSAGITRDGSVFVVTGNPRQWTKAYDAPGSGGSPAVGVTVGAQTLGYVLQDGSVSVQQLGAEGGSATNVWSVEGGRSPAVAVDASVNDVVVLTEDGAVHIPDPADPNADAVVWTPEQGKATQVSAVKAGVFVLHDGVVSFTATDGQAASLDLPLQGIVDIDARTTKVAALDGNGTVTVVDVSEAEPKSNVLWDGSAAEGKVTNIAMGANVVMLFSDGTIRSKAPGAADPAKGGRLAWNQVDKWGPAVAIGSIDKLITFELEDGKSRWADLSAPEGERGGVYYRLDGAQAMVAFAS